MSLARGKGISTLSAVVTHADGTTEDLGIISINGRPATWWRKLILRLRGGLRHG